MASVFCTVRFRVSLTLSQYFVFKWVKVSFCKNVLYILLSNMKTTFSQIPPFFIKKETQNVWDAVLLFIPYLWISKIHFRISIIHFWISKNDFRISQNNYGYPKLFLDIQKCILGYYKIIMDIQNYFWISKNVF